MTHVMGIAEIVRNRCVVGQSPVVQHPGNFAVDTRGIGLLDDKGTVETAPDLLEAALMWVIPEGAGIDCIEFIDELVARGDRHLCKVRHPVHCVRKPDTMPMHGGFLCKVVGNLDLQAFALPDADLRARYFAVVAPGRGVGMWLRNKPCSSLCGPEREFLGGGFRRPRKRQSGGHDTRERRRDKGAARHGRFAFQRHRSGAL